MAVAPDGIVVTWQCGHQAALPPTITAPACPECGNRRVRAVVAPPPRITATDCAATSPLLQE